MISYEKTIEIYQSTIDYYTEELRKEVERYGHGTDTGRALIEQIKNFMGYLSNVSKSCKAE